MMAARKQNQNQEKEREDDLEGLSLEKLDTLLTERNNERDAMQQEIRTLRAIRDRKAMAEQAHERVAGLSDVERKALAQELSLAAADGGLTAKG